jgi:serine/threonine protein kinase
MNERSGVTTSAGDTTLINITPGTRLLNNKFELEEQLGAGGCGVVYRAVDLDAAKLGDPRPRIALKVLNEDIQELPVARLSLQRELSRARRLTHPNIVRVYEFYEDHGTCFITMELLEGTSWDALIRNHPQGMALKEAAPLIEQLFAALTYAHSHGVIHSDLKPQNLFLTGNKRVKVLDFGIAAEIRPTKSSSSEHTLFDPRRTGARTEVYAPLEIWQQWDADPRDDVYSAACIVYELLSGAHPYDRRSAPRALELKLVPPPIKSLTKAQNLALRQALQLERDQRTPSIDAFAAQLLGKSAGRGLSWRVAGAAVAVGAIAAAAFMRMRMPMPLPMPDKPQPQPPTPPGISFEAAHELALVLNMVDAPFRPGLRYSRADILTAVARTPRRALLGSTPEQLVAAAALCRESLRGCDMRQYADEAFRRPVLGPFRLDATAVTVAAFRKFIESTHYRTEAERRGGTYALLADGLHWKPRGNWANAAGTGTPSDESAVVGVSFADAQAYCSWRGARLPTEDQWEYAARGPAGWTFPWGNDPAPARVSTSRRPEAGSGLAEGPDGTLHGLSGDVWEWVDTAGAGGAGRKTLKGGSWLETNAANRRAAAHRSEVATRADADSGFRCAQSQAEWSDAEFWVKPLR